MRGDSGGGTQSQSSMFMIALRLCALGLGGSKVKFPPLDHPTLWVLDGAVV
jgi:hypothetical protein